MTNGNESAFAKTANRDFGDSPEYGLTKREYFAAMALQGILSNSVISQAVADCLAEGRPANLNVGEEAVGLAEELIQALNKEAK